MRVRPVGTRAVLIEVETSTDVRTLYDVWVGRTALKEAVASGRLELIGAPSLTRRMPSVMKLSVAAPWVRAAST